MGVREARCATRASVTRSAWPTALAVAAAYAFATWRLRQTSLYGDASIILSGIASGSARHDLHLAYYGVFGWLEQWLAPHGWSAHEVGLALSRAGASACLALLYLAARVARRPAREALLLAIAFGCAPAVLFFATTVEVHGPFMFWIGATALAAAWCTRNPTRARLALLGCVTGASYFFHATGHLLAALAAVMLLAHFVSARGGRLERKFVAAAATAIAAHLATVVLAVVALRWCGIPVNTESGWSYAAALARMHWDHPQLLARVTWNEWLVPFLPWSIAACGAFAVRALRSYALAFAAALIAYLALSWSMLATLDERGAYLLPMLVPAIGFSLRAFGPRWCLAGIALSLVVEVAQVRAHDRPEPLTAYASDCRAALGDRHVLLLVGNGIDLEACLVAMPDYDFIAVGPLGSAGGARSGELLRHVHDELRIKLREYDRVVLTKEAKALLELGGRRGHAIGPQVLESLHAAFRLSPIESNSFAGYWIEE